MTNRQNLVSAVIITFNEEKNIEKCLKSLQWVDEIIIIDSYSKDNTIAIAKKYTRKIYFKKFNNNYSVLRNYALKYVKNKWILVLDADEIIPKLSINIIKHLVNNHNIYGYLFPRRNYINEKSYLKNGYFYPDYQLRLFQKLKELKYIGEIHEWPNIPKNKIKTINQVEIYHNNSHTKYNSYLSFFRFIPYIKIESRQIAASNKTTFNIFITGIV